MRLSKAWEPLFDPQLKLVRPKTADGIFIDPFDPSQPWRGFQEGNAWQYTYFVPHDPQALIKKVGQQTFNIWNWQQPRWPDFIFERSLTAKAEDEFLQNAGFIKGLLTHIADDEKMLLTVDALSDEAIQTSEIEGEYLIRESVQSSIRRNFGLMVEDNLNRED